MTGIGLTYIPSIDGKRPPDAKSRDSGKQRYGGEGCQFGAVSEKKTSLHERKMMWDVITNCRLVRPEEHLLAGSADGCAIVALVEELLQ